MIYPRILAALDMLILFTKLSVMEFQVRYLVLFGVFSVIDGFPGFWMGSLHKNIQLMLGFPKALLLVLHFFYYTLMTFQMMICVYNIAIYMLIILPSTLSLIRHLVCDNNYRIGFST